jgi:hypothetical protein
MAYDNGTECSETVAHKIQMLGNHPKECCKLSFVSFSKLLCAVA